MGKYTRRPCYRHVPTCGFTSSQAGARAGPAVGTHGVWDRGSWDALPRCRHHPSASRAGVSFAGIGGGHLAGFLPRSSLPVGGHLRGCPRPPPMSWAAGDTQRGGRRPADAAEVSAPPAHLCFSERCAHSPPGSLRVRPRGALLAGHEDELSQPTRAALSPPGASGPLSQPLWARCRRIPVTPKAWSASHSKSRCLRTPARPARRGSQTRGDWGRPLRSGSPEPRAGGPGRPRQTLMRANKQGTR